MVSRAYRIGGGLLLLAALTALFFFGREVLTQWDRLRRYQPVNATIEESSVKVSRGRRSKNYKPLIYFRYEVDGQTYRGWRICPVSENWQRTAANEVTRRNPVGSLRQAYYDPVSPGEGFLERRPAFQPYFLSMLCGAGVAGAALLWFSGRRRTPNQAEVPPQVIDGAEWWPLEVEHEIGRRLAKWRSGALAMILFAALPVHYLIIAWPDPGMFGWAACGAYAAAMLVFIGIWMHASSVFRRFVDPMVVIDRPDPMAGEEFTVRVAAAMLRGAAGAELSVGMLCREGYREKKGNKTHQGERIVYQQWYPGEPLDTDGPEGSASADFVVGVPAGRPGTTDLSSGEDIFPNYTWLIGVRIKVRGGADLKALYPVAVSEPETILKSSDAQSATESE